jgi:type II restriction/modification system DNA methylase subunit YeeA
MTPTIFIRKWRASSLKERSASQEHFIDLCHLVGHPTPAEADPEGTWFTFEKGASKTGGGEGWADAWKKGHFAWEYKGKKKDLTAAFAQLQRYAIALENPPLLVVSDMDTIIIHTNFTNTVPDIHTIAIDDIGTPENLQKLKWLFNDPEKLKPGLTAAEITQNAATEFAVIAQAMRERGHEPLAVAHFLNKILFCLFAEDVELLPKKLFERLLEAGEKHPDKLNKMLADLFKVMSEGGIFGYEAIEWFNGGLFDGNDVVPLVQDEISALVRISRLDWSRIEPSIFGTLFERGLDPSKRSQLGAHYTDPDSIMRLVQPVIIDPLLDEWAQIKTEIAEALEKRDTLKSATAQKKWQGKAEELVQRFLYKLSHYKILDPACGSGNFLYLALKSLKDIEDRVNIEAEQLGLSPHFLEVGPQCVYGIELNTYAAELARVTVWIGEIQWMLNHSYNPSKNPILKKLDQIDCRDALMNPDGSEAEWPEVRSGPQ